MTRDVANGEGRHPLCSAHIRQRDSRLLSLPKEPGRLQVLLGEEEADSVLSYDCSSLALTGTTQLNRELSYPAAEILVRGG